MVEMLGGHTQTAHPMTLIGILGVVVANNMGEQREMCRQQQRHDPCAVAPGYP